MTIATVVTDLYDRDGVTLLAAGLDATVTWQDELSRPGTATVRIPADQAALVADRTILKFSLGGQVRYGCRVTGETTQLAVDNLTTIHVELPSQPGLLSMLADAVVLPEYGVHRISSAERTFGFMSKRGAWYHDADWSTPATYPMAGDTVRTGHPASLAATNPDWIGAVSPAYVALRV